MPLILGNPLIVTESGPDSTGDQKLLGCNSSGSLRVAPCGCLTPLSAEIPIAAGQTWESPLIEITDNAKWDIQLCLTVVSGNDITGYQVRYYPDPDDDSIYEVIARPQERIGAGETFCLYGLELNALSQIDNGSLYPFMYKGLKLFITCDAGSATVVKPHLFLTPRV